MFCHRKKTVDVILLTIDNDTKPTIVIIILYGSPMDKLLISSIKLCIFRLAGLMLWGCFYGAVPILLWLPVL